jgi:hypothetical protein
MANHPVDLSLCEISPMCSFCVISFPRAVSVTSVAIPAKWRLAQGATLANQSGPDVAPRGTFCAVRRFVRQCSAF